MTDRTLLYTSAFLRSFATGMVGVVLGLYFSLLQLPHAAAGYVIAAGLAGAALASAVVTFAGDRWGRRKCLVALSLLGAAGALGATWSGHPWVLGLAVCIGMLNGMGRDRGAALILDQAILPAVTSGIDRTKAFAVYNVCQDVGHALGSLAAGVPALMESSRLVPAATSLGGYHALLLLYASLAIGSAVIYARLSPAVEPQTPAARNNTSPETRRKLSLLSSLFLLDSLGSGFLATALLTYYFFERFAAPPEMIAALFFVSRVANALSHLAAAWLAGWIGLVNTMVFTHIPSSVLLVTVAFAPNFPVAAILFVLRESLVEMDVPTRQSYVMAIVRPHERTLASGFTNLVRMAGWAVAPAAAGLFMQTTSLAAPLFIGAGLKIAYDLALYRSFKSVKPPEES